MGNIYMIAGQSNADNAFEAIRAGLLAQDPTCTVIGVAAAGAPLTWARQGSDWYRPAELTQEVTDALTAALRADPEARLGGIVWIQGEADTLDCARPEDYGARLSSLFSTILADLRGTPSALTIEPAEAPLLVVGLSSFAPAAAERDAWTIVQQAQLAFSAGWDGAGFVNMDMLAALAGIPADLMFRDRLHYSDALTDALGTALADWLTGERGGLGAAIAPVTLLGTDSADEIGNGPPSADLQQKGGEGATVMVGYGGDDRYRITAADTLVVELAGEGRDRVLVYSDYDMGRMAQGVEDLVVAGTGGRVATGNALANTMTGGGGADRLSGGEGSDTLRGGKGSDLVDGGTGKDNLVGGGGSDRFVFAAIGESGLTESTADVIADFRRGQDRIDLRGIDAFAATGGNDAFVWRGTGGFTSASNGEVSFRKVDTAGTANDHTLVLIDNDGDRGAEMAIRLTGLHNLTAADFIL